MENSKENYSQPTKKLARRKALTHAVQLLTERRSKCAITPQNYVDRIKNDLSRLDRHPGDNYAATAMLESDIESWRHFWKDTVGELRLEQVTVAYLAGPEPENDLLTLIELGIRPENIWAFENHENTFDSAKASLRSLGLRGVKLMQIRIDDYFSSTPKRFDIIYIDACAPFPSHSAQTTRTIANIFKNSSLSSLGVLITNFSKPDETKAITIRDYGQLIANYLFPKGWLDCFERHEETVTDGASESAYTLETDEENELEMKSFVTYVADNFSDCYGSFITRMISDISSIISPAVRIFNSGLSDQLTHQFTHAVEMGNLRSHGDVDEGGPELLSSPSNCSLLFTLVASNLIKDHENHLSLSNDQNKFNKRWANQLSGLGFEQITAIEAITAFYSIAQDESLWSDHMKELKNYDYFGKMPHLCDAPTEQIAFYSNFAQLAYPAHNNVSETKRYRYTAEGKTNEMYLDVMPFDECRYIYDWLPTAPFMDKDWDDRSRQLVFRAALDSLAKNNRWYQDDYLYGCHMVGINEKDFDAPTYSPRERIDLTDSKPG
ncbi:hypothetical protein VDQ94_01685 [Xanthomonas campestris pv. campestris]|nr:hypothetical protein [Xanthomonas campestris pv. campestris]MEB1554604.1 hypothetical protein [Xanthomonas campestris pv. campestris]